MTYRRACAALGAGDIGRGRALLYELAARLEAARAQHPVYARDAVEACGVILDELAELRYAIHSESNARQRDEALDVAAVVVRLLAGEAHGGA